MSDEIRGLLGLTLLLGSGYLFYMGYMAGARRQYEVKSVVTGVRG